ncbi:MAG: FAD-dependent oxidoreductase [Thalassobaculales bacterium]
MTGAAVLTPDLCVIGAGSGGLSVAAGAVQMGAPTVLVERALMGGDCLNHGCVPSKALLAAGKAGLDHAAALERLHQVIAEIAPHDSQERFEGLGVTVLRQSARFLDPRTIAAGELLVRPRRFVIATGSAPLVPPIPGLSGVPYLTNETIFHLRERPSHLIVLGGGPIGVEMAQAHRRFGVAVTVVEMAGLLPRDDPEAVEVLRARLLAEGITLVEGGRATAVEAAGPGIRVTVEREGAARMVEGSHLLVALGRRPAVGGLDLEAAGIAHDARGITVDQGLRTTNRRAFAIGDCAGGPQFTHAAAYHAGIVLRRALFRLPARVDYAAFPWVTYTDPELAQVGATEAEARARHGAVNILRWPFADNDRARTERRHDGFVKAVVSPRGAIHGCTIVGPAAGELIAPWALAIAKGLTVKDIAALVLPYPTLGEASKRAAGSFFAPRLFSAGTRRLVRFLARFG